jgi:hypothetical protein
MATKKVQKKGGKGLAIGALAAGAAAAAAAGYFFYASPDAKKNRKIAVKWAGDMKKDVVREAKKLKNIDKAQLASIVDEAAAAYTSVKNVDKKDIVKAAKELKANWKMLAAELPRVSVKKAAKSVAKKAAKSARKS